MSAYKNPQLGIEERINDLILHMTLDDKIGQLNQISVRETELEQARELAKDGKIGSIILASTAFAGNEEQKTAYLADRNEIQRVAVEESRLGIPIIYGRDIIHGHRTVFPIPLAQAASWNPELVEKAASIAALEASSAGVHWTFAPMMDISRDPRWGRIIEGSGEDTYLSSVMAKACVKGFQGEDLSGPGSIAACAKHFIGYGASEGGRDYNSADFSDNTLRNFYLPPFKAAIDAGVSTVMSSFNELGGVPVTASHYLLTEVLKDELGFDGFIISDWNAIIQLISQGTASDKKDAACQAINAGIDMDMVDKSYINHLPELVAEGKVDKKRIDDAVRRILRIKFRLGLFENPYTDIETAKKVQLHPDHIACARELAARSMVLLENKNSVLPLPKKGVKIAVIGPMANEKRALMGSWTLDGVASDVVSICEGIKAAAPEAEIITSPTSLTDDMAYAARKADIVVVALGESHIRTGEAQSVADISLPHGQEELVEAISLLNKQVVAVVCAGRPLSITKTIQHAQSVLYAWHPGIQGGMAVADILFGNTNPSGKLPVTFPMCTGQIPLYYNHKNAGRKIDEYYDDYSFMNYHDSTGKPLYPFGHGLSYTEFHYGEINVNRKQIKPGEEVIVSVSVTNTGKFTGEEIVQCYISDTVASMTRPVRELKAFKRVSLKPGETQKVSFTLSQQELSFYGCDGKLRLEPGEFVVRVGANCLTNLKASFEII